MNEKTTMTVAGTAGAMALGGLGFAYGGLGGAALGGVAGAAAGAAVGSWLHGVFSGDGGDDAGGEGEGGGDVGGDSEGGDTSGGDSGGVSQ